MLLASSSTGFGQLSLTFSTAQLYRQNPSTSTFRKLPEGTPSFSLVLKDGSAAIVGCALNQSEDWFGPLPPAGCPKGATAYIVAGDVDNDGVRDDFTHWEITGVTPAVAIDASHPELCTVYSRPPGIFPLEKGFIDNTTIVYFNTQTEAIKEYKLSSYRIDKDYITRDDMDAAIVSGSYIFHFPRLGNPNVAVPIPLMHHPIPKGSKEQNHYRQGFRFTKLNGEPLRWNADGFVELDSRVLNSFEWEGNGVEIMIMTADTLYFAIMDLGTAGAKDPERDVPDETVTLWPKFTGTPGTPRVIMANATTSGFTVPPGWPIDVNADPAVEGVAEVTIVRSAPTSTVATDAVTHRFQLPLRYVDTYEGWAAVMFPIGTTAAERAANFDYDGDGATNWEEYSAVPQTDPTDPNDKPGAPKLTFVEGRAVRSTSSASAGYWETKTAKMQNVSPAITYQYEFSADLKNWSVIGNDDPNWLVIDTTQEIKLQSRNARLEGRGFLRVKKTQGPKPQSMSLD